MTDGQYLLLIFATLYFIECLRWLPQRSRLLLGGGKSGAWRMLRPFQPMKIAERCPALLGALPPLQIHLITQPWQVVPAEAGLELHPDNLPPQVLPWSQVVPQVQGRTLWLSKGSSVRCISEEQASHLGHQVKNWLSMPQEEREESFLTQAQQSMETAPLSRQAEELAAKTRMLRLMGSVIFFWTFIIVAAIYRWLGDSLEVLIAVAVLFCLQMAQAVLFFRKARGVPWRFWKSVAVALLPQHAMRAADHLADQAAHGMPAHPLAARTLIGEEAWKKLAEHCWKKARYQPSATSNLQCRALQTALEETGLSVADLDKPPAQQEGSSLYCPRCHSQFQSSAHQCRDCGGVALQAF